MNAGTCWGKNTIEPKEQSDEKTRGRELKNKKKMCTY
jgi:hypothetical protein